MASESRQPEVAERDGTSQAGRSLAALDPSYVSVDERTPEELLAFARAYGRELTYYGRDGNPAGDWSGFLGPELRLSDVAAFLAEPEKFSPETTPALFRPHLVLFLTFLKLLDQTRGELNALTRRHLDFYFRQILRMARRRSIPDRVNLVFELAPDSRAVLLPGGSLLSAGPDLRGRDRVYATDRDLIVNRARIATLRSLFVDRRRLGLRQVPRHYLNDKERCCEEMFAIAIALGEPLPPYADGAAVEFEKLKALRELLRRAESVFYLSISAMRDLMARKQLRPPAPAEWDEINALLEAAGTRKRGGVAFKLDRSSRDFAGNLERAVGTLSFGTLPQVTRVEDLYELRGRSDVQAYIRDKLYFPHVDDFARMMQLKRKFETEWGEINRLLEEAGQRRRSDPQYQLQPADVTAFAANLQSAIGASEAALSRYWQEVQALERYFYMPAEHFAFAMDEVLGKKQEEWEQIFPILDQAHQEKIRQDRRDALRALREATPPARLVDLIRYALGEVADPAEDPTALDRLVPYLGQADTDKLPQLEKEGRWDRIYSLLEVAERNQLGEPPAEKVEWFNLYPAADATAVRSRRMLQLTGEEQGDAPRWPPFGLAQPTATPSPAPQPVLGWALSSPILVLGEGTRVITLTLGFRRGRVPLSAIFLKGGELPLLFSLSTAKGYIDCAVSAPTFGTYSALSATAHEGEPQGVQFVLTLPATVDAIAALPAELSGSGSPWPELRLMLRPLWSNDHKQHVARYPELSQLELMAAHVKVEVSGLKSIFIQNDESILDARRPFEPFGSEPAAGSRFLIGHPEIAGKRLDSLTFSFQWMGAPANLQTHYANYELPSNSRFTAKVSLIDGAWETPLDPAAALFGSSGAAPVSLRVTQPLAAARPVGPEILAPRPKGEGDGEGEALDEDLTSWPRYLQWELNSPDFQHADYPAIAARKALALAVDTAKGAATINPDNYQVKPPYTPKLKSLTLGYTSALALRFDDASRDARTHRVLHVHPFGSCDIEAERTSAGLPFLPRYENDGELYLALRDLTPPQTVSIFFQVAEGSADPDRQPQPVRWSYLDGDRWVALERQVLSDTTRSLSNSGIVELELPVAAPSTRLAGASYWVRAALAQDTPGVCDVVGVHTQAVSATFDDRDNAPEHFGAPLPAESIAELAAPIPEIARVRQPYTSYGGRMAEREATWATRVSERLRHKGRALSMWDYERLILDRFPELHKVKCIPPQPQDPGRVEVIVIPNIRNQIPFAPFDPKAPANLLADVQSYLQARAPASARVVVRNAHYVAVRVHARGFFSAVGESLILKPPAALSRVYFLCRQ